MSEQPPIGDPGREPTEEEVLAAYEAELKQIQVDDVIIRMIVSLLNLGGRRAGLVPGSEDERDLEQVRLAIEAVRLIFPLVEDTLGSDAGPLREAVSRLQMAYAQLIEQGAGAPEQGAGAPAQGAGGPGAGDPAAGDPRAGEPGPGGPGGERPGAEQAPPAAGEPGPAQRSGRLWVPGQ